MAVLEFTGEFGRVVEVERGDGLTNRVVPTETVVEVCGTTPTDIINSVNKAAQILAWDTRTLARLAGSLIPLLEHDPSLLDTIDPAVFDALLAAAQRRVATMPVGDMIEHLRGMQECYGAESTSPVQCAAWQELDDEYTAWCAGVGR